jgi:AraC-like DNA-binding protein
MTPDFIQKLKKVILKLQQTKSNRRINLPGAQIYSVERKNFSIQIHQFMKPAFSIRYALLSFINKNIFTIKENESGIRIEAVLTGELKYTGDDSSYNTVRPGEYRLTNDTELVAFFKKNSACSYFITRYSDEMLEQIGIKEIVKPADKRFLSPKMRALIQNILNHPLNDKMRDFYYENCVRELLFLHLTDTHHTLPAYLSDDDLAAIYHADSLLLQNLKSHITIPLLSQKVGLNEFKLKRGFRSVFEMGIFERLTWHRMELAKYLLRTTRRTIDDIADEAGYSGRTSFITAFRKNFETTPKQWRALMSK